MLTPLEPSIDINNELSLSLPFNLSDKKYQYQGEFGNVFIENINDYYQSFFMDIEKSTKKCIIREKKLFNQISVRFKLTFFSVSN